MRTPRTRAGLALLVVTGMLLLFGGVVAGSAVGTLLRPELEGRPLLLGRESRAGETQTRLFATTSGGAFWATQNGPGAAIRGESARGRGGVFVSGHRSASGVLAENDASSLGDGAAVVANGNANVGLRATSDGVAIVAEGQELAIYAPGNSLLTGDLTVHGACIGCQLVAVAVNASDVSLNPGDAVTVVGTRTDESGTLLLEVRPAAAGDRAMGIVLESAAHTTVPTGLAAEVATYSASDGSARPGDPLRLALAGIVPSARGDASGGEIQAGDSLVPSATEGILAKAGPDIQAGGAVGYALGPLTAGQLAVLIDLH